MGLGIALLLGLIAPRAGAASQWIFRGLTLPRGDVALDLGLGLGHEPGVPVAGADRSTTGFGLNLEIAFGVSHDLELGFRTGTRFGVDGEVTRADRYGRPWDTEAPARAYGGDSLANPELRMRWAVAQGSTLQLGLEGRVYLPIEAGTRAAVMFGLPLRLRLGAARIDTGVYVPVIFTDPTSTEVSFPFHLWIQASPTLWLGPLLWVRIGNDGNTGNRSGHTEYPLGFGLGLGLTRGIDLRTWVLFPDINGDAAARRFGAGVALQIRFE